MFYVYVLYNKANDKIYIGQTSDIARRLEEHAKKRGNHYTAKYSGYWNLAYQEELPNRASAIQRERQLKSHAGRDFIRSYINKHTSGSIPE